MGTPVIARNTVAAIDSEAGGEPATVAIQAQPPERPALRVGLANVGCKLNAYEVEAFKFDLDRRGFEIVPFHAAADVYVVNTCTVTGSGDADSRKLVRRATRANPGATVVATGCYAQRRPEDLKSAGANLIVGNGDKAGLVDQLERFLAGESIPLAPSSPAPHTDTFLSIDGLVEQGRTRGTVQIQDGCSEHCTYCIIPSVRGTGVSRPLEETVEQARRMAAAGYRELALTGVHSGSYGMDRGEPNGLVGLLRALEEIEPLQRIRLNSIEPGYVSDELLRFAAQSTKLCRHFHIPLQSGDNRVLRRMGRRYTGSHYSERVERIKCLMPDCAIGTDVMVGFPGETEEEFERTHRLLTGLPISYLHVFPFSTRPGTAAEKLREQHSAETKKERSRRLLTLGDHKRLEFHRRFLGRPLEILVEDRVDKATGLRVGMSDNYVKVLFEGDEIQTNQIISVVVTAAREQLVLGQLQSGAGDQPNQAEMPT